ncbi:hypothetical protein V6N12_045485 [Hibiscus sabdariffa]|uniref:Uncharacterized protein n=1 Tax=Hibiscus sabdariffa TaxID=183260 RepID=A0ABR2G321_9ROSI
MSMTLFYSAGDESHPGKSSNHLTNSLSKILTHYYPFVGRLNHDGLTIDCNDEGVVFVEARVSSEVPFVVDEPENEVLQRGGVAIGVCISHVIANGAAAVGFLKALARFACGSPDTIEIDSVVYDC